MYKIVWKESFGVGIKEIDEQHKKLVGTINKLFELIDNNSVNNSIDKIFEELTEYSEKHFETEEKYMKDFKFDQLDDHLEEHNYFRKTLKDLKNKYPKIPDKTKIELSNFLKDWLLNHIMDVDKEYVDLFKKNGVK